jgi:hypothetical protein
MSSTPKLCRHLSDPVWEYFSEFNVYHIYYTV